MELAAKALLGAVVVLLVAALSRTRSYYVAGLVARVRLAAALAASTGVWLVVASGLVLVWSRR
jgi:uncharacterized membrane protein (GlpM family)